MTTSKYALVERERRYLVRSLPAEAPSARRTLTDLYLDGTRLRLRRSEGLVNGHPELVRKLTQKLPAPDATGGRRGHLTTMYLDEAEYDQLADLPGRWLTKQRLSYPPLGVDVFTGPLAGLMVAEAEFTDDESMLAFLPPPWCGAEITDHPELTGAHLARIAALPAAEATTALAAALTGFTDPPTPGGSSV